MPITAISPALLDAIDQVVVAIHGVRSFGDWGDRLADQMVLDSRFRSTLYLTYDYPKIPAVFGWGATWFPWLRHHYTDWMLKKLEDVARRYPGKPLKIVAHSYGTWIAYHAIRLSAERGVAISVDTICLVAGVLSSTDPLMPINEGKIGRLYNYFSSNDRVVSFAPPPFGHCGSSGFLGALPSSVENVGDWRLGHGGYWTAPAFYTRLLNDLAPL